MSQEDDTPKASPWGDGHNGEAGSWRQELETENHQAIAIPLAKRAKLGYCR